MTNEEILVSTELKYYSTESFSIYSSALNREVKIDAYLPKNRVPDQACKVLLVNDGQDLPKMPFDTMMDRLVAEGRVEPLVVIGIHAGEERRLEYGTADVLDFMQRGSKAVLYRDFILNELLAVIQNRWEFCQIEQLSFAGFSLGGLSALDIAWKHSDRFTKVGVFSGSLWWRLRDLDNGYVEETDRIMHLLIRQGTFVPGMKFFFSSGTLDETADRNNNGIIDSIDDTMALIDELEKKGYRAAADIAYLELADGRHDVATWARAFPAFLEWGWGVAAEK